MFQGEEIRGGEHCPAGRHDPSQGGQAHHLPGGRTILKGLSHKIARISKAVVPWIRIRFQDPSFELHRFYQNFQNLSECCCNYF